LSRTEQIPSGTYNLAVLIKALTTFNSSFIKALIVCDSSLVRGGLTKSGGVHGGDT